MSLKELDLLNAYINLQTLLIAHTTDISSSEGPYVLFRRTRVRLPSLEMTELTHELLPSLLLAEITLTFRMKCDGIFTHGTSNKIHSLAK
jgi:hypothetical protein